MTRDEYDFCTGPMGRRGQFAHTTEASELGHLRELREAGRLTLAGHAYRVAPAARPAAAPRRARRPRPWRRWASMKDIKPGAAVGFVGLGKMGAPMATRLAVAGYQVQGYDVSEETARSWAERVGGSPAADLGAAAAGAAAVILMLPYTRRTRRARTAILDRWGRSGSYPGNGTSACIRSTSLAPLPDAVALARGSARLGAAGVAGHRRRRGGRVRLGNGRRQR